MVEVGRSAPLTVVDDRSDPETEANALSVPVTPDPVSLDVTVAVGRSVPVTVSGTMMPVDVPAAVSPTVTTRAAAPVREAEPVAAS
jgi:hypothetical protein